MSRLAFRSPETSPLTITPPQTVNTHHVIMEVTLKPVAMDQVDHEQVAKQATVLKALRSKGGDLFEMNEMRKVESAGTTLYQTSETYGTAMSVESISEQLTSAQLTLRVNFKRPGIHSNTTCMGLSAATLYNLMQSTADANGHKIAELRVKQESGARVPPHGAMYVAIVLRGTQHYMSHIDYKIISNYDAMYHEQ